MKITMTRRKLMTRNRRSRNRSDERRDDAGSTEIAYMKRNVLVVNAVMIVLGLGIIGSALAQDDEGPKSALRFVVVRDSDGKPVRNAEVVLHPVKREGKQAKGEMELKTDAEGRTNRTEPRQCSSAPRRPSSTPSLPSLASLRVSPDATPPPLSLPVYRRRLPPTSNGPM